MATATAEGAGPLRHQAHRRARRATPRTQGTQLQRAVGVLDLTALGLGAIIGTGIFVIIGEAIGDVRPGDHPLLRPRRRHVRVLRALLRRAGLVDPGLGQRLHVLATRRWASSSPGSSAGT